MAYCGNCGNQIEDGTRFCPMCGVAQNPVAPTRENTPLYKKKFFLPTLIGSAVTIVAIIVLCIFLGGDADDSDVRASNKSEFGEVIKVENYESNHMALDTEEKEIEEREIEESGLEDLIEVDPFSEKYFHPELKGTSPYLKLDAGFTNDDIFLSGWYSFEKWEKIREGDIITVNFYTDFDELISRGYTVSRKKFEYQISNVSRYVDELEDIDESTMEKLADAAIEKVKEFGEENSYRKEKYSISDIKYEGTIVYRQGYISKYNRVYIICSATVTDIRDREKVKDFHEPTKVYYPVTFENLKFDADGNYMHEKYYGKIPENRDFSLNFEGGTSSGGYIDLYVDHIYNDYVMKDSGGSHTFSMTDSLYKLFNIHR